MKISKEFKVGLLAIVSITILYLGFNFLKGIDFFSASNQYYAVYEKIDGLNVSNNVILNGLSVGRVAEIKILPRSGNKIVVEFDINSDIELYNSTVAKLTDDGILGSKVVELLISESPTGKVLEDGDTLNSELDKGLIASFQETAAPITDELETTLTRVNLLLEANTESISKTMVNLEQTSSLIKTTVQQNQSEVNQLLENVNEAAKQLAFVMQDLPPVINKMNQFADSLNDMQLAATAQKLQATVTSLNQSIEKINQGQGSLGKLMHDDSLYVNLNHAAENLDKLMIDLRERPGRYVNFSIFGRKND